MKIYFSVGETAKAVHTTIETLRHYDRIGLVKPSKKDDFTNYRYYTHQDIVRINTVRALQQMDLSLKKIKEVLEIDDLEKIINLLNEAETKVDEKMALLECSRAKIHLAKSDYENKLHGYNNVMDIENLRCFLSTMCNDISSQLKSSKVDNNEYVTAACTYIEENYTKSISATDISCHLNLSYPYLSKLFKDFTNINIIDYINVIRIEKSKEMLSNTQLTIPVIAQSVGYSNHQSFQRYFKKLVNMTPGEYRKLN